MKDAVERRALGLVVAFFRHFAGRFQQDLGDLVGIDQQRISRYELGVVRPGRRTLERMAQATGVSTERLDQLMALYRAICAEVGDERPAEVGIDKLWEPELEEDVEEILAEVAEAIKPGIYALLASFDADLAGGDSFLDPQKARDLAADSWRRIRPLTHDIRLEALEFESFHNWALCERLCEECLQATTDDLETARELAEEALTIAEKVSAGATPRPRLIAYSLAHMAKVESSFGDLEEAAEKFRRAREMWQVGDGSDGLEDARFEALLGAGS